MSDEILTGIREKEEEKKETEEHRLLYDKLTEIINRHKVNLFAENRMNGLDEALKNSSLSNGERKMIEKNFKASKELMPSNQREFNKLMSDLEVILQELKTPSVSK